MFNLEKPEITGQTNKLLYDVLQELKQLNKNLRPTREGTEVKTYSCKYCNESFESRHKMASHVGKCPKKPKKEAK